MQQERETAGGVAREQPRARLRREPLVRDALRLEGRDRLRLPAVLAVREPAQAALDQELLAALGLELAPQACGRAAPRPCSRRPGRGRSGSGATRRPRWRAGRRARTGRPASPPRRPARATMRARPRRHPPRRSPRCAWAEGIGGRPAPRPDRPHVGWHPPPQTHRVLTTCGVVRAFLAGFLIALAAPAAAGAATFGESVRGRPLEVTQRGDPAAPVRLLVVGSIHGNETAGHAVIARLRRLAPPPGVQLWLVRTANPDGVSRGTRQNARGVDLNRNFPFRWAGGGAAFDTYFPGRAPASEPETRALQRLIAEIEPDLTLYYHQHMRLVSLAHGSDNTAGARLRAPRRPAAALAPVLPRHGHELAEPPRAGDDRVRRRAARRAAVAPRRPAPRARRARRRPGPGRDAPRRLRSRRSSGTRSRSAPTARARCGATRGATTATRRRS